jgi:hypothetical protein
MSINQFKLNLYLMKISLVKFQIFEGGTNIKIKLPFYSYLLFFEMLTCSICLDQIFQIYLKIFLKVANQNSTIFLWNLEFSTTRIHKLSKQNIDNYEFKFNSRPGLICLNKTYFFTSCFNYTWVIRNSPSWFKHDFFFSLNSNLSLRR